MAHVAARPGFAKGRRRCIASATQRYGGQAGTPALLWTSGSCCRQSAIGNRKSSIRGCHFCNLWPMSWLARELRCSGVGRKRPPVASAGLQWPQSASSGLSRPQLALAGLSWPQLARDGQLPGVGRGLAAMLLSRKRLDTLIADDLAAGWACHKCRHGAVMIRIWQELAGVMALRK